VSAGHILGHQYFSVFFKNQTFSVFQKASVRFPVHTRATLVEPVEAFLKKCTISIFEIRSLLQFHRSGWHFGNLPQHQPQKGA
jgi:hypothetical protein